MAPARAEIARYFWKILNAEAERTEEDGDRMRAAVALTLAGECLKFAHEFERWATMDVGTEHREQQTLSWMDFERGVHRFLRDRTMRTPP